MSMSGGLDMKNESAVSSVVGVVLLLLLVVLAASVIGITLSTATQNAAESTPNVIFAPSANPQMLYHSGGDILYKNRLVFYNNGVDITDLTQINGDDAWVEWRTGQAIDLPSGYSVSNLTIIALDNLGREQLLYRGSGVPTTPLPTPEPTPNPYYVVGSKPYANASAFIQSVNDWQAGTFVYENDYHQTGRPILKKDIIVGNEPILITDELIGSSGVFEIAGSQTGDIPSIRRAPGYDGALLVIEADGFQISYGAITFDGMGHGNEPIIIVGEGTTFYAAEYFTVKNGMNEDGAGVEGGGIYNDGTLTMQNSGAITNCSALEGGGIYNANNGIVTINDGQVTISGNSAQNGGGVYTIGKFTSQASIKGNTAQENGGGIYNVGEIPSLQGIIENNIALGKGGGIYNIGLFYTESLSLNYNTAEDGGGFYNDNEATKLGATIKYNTATNNGGGIYNSATGFIRDGWPTIQYNTAEDGYGGGLYNSGYIFTQGWTITSNYAPTNPTSANRYPV